MKRLVRLILLAAVVAGVVAAVRSRQQGGSPLPSPGTARSEPWPPLRAEPAGTSASPPRPAPTPTRTTATTATTDQTEQVAPEPAGTPVGQTTPVWVAPTGEGECPDGYPIKAKMSSKIFHSPGQLNYDRTTPDRCYVDASQAESDGLRAAKR